MKKSRIHKAIIMLSMILGIALMLISCGPTYVRSGYGYNRPYSYGYNYPRPYRYSVPPPVVVVPRYSYPNRRNGSYGHHGRGRRY
jgi:hypothetical protein